MIRIKNLTKEYGRHQGIHDVSFEIQDGEAFGLLGPRTCGDCRITDTLYWKVQQQSLPIVLEETLTAEELKTWQRIKNEPESLLTEE